MQAAENRFDDAGTLNRITLGPGWMDLSARVKVPLKGWDKSLTMEKGKVSHLESNGRKYWQAHLSDGESADLEIVQTATETDTTLILEFVASAYKDCDIEGVLLWIDLPANMFATGTFKADGPYAGSGWLPAQLPKQRILRSGMLESVHLETPDKSIGFNAKLNTPANITLQDSRQWSPNFSLLIYIHQGAMLKGQTAKLNVALSLTGAPEQVPAEFKLDAATARYSVIGLGGNYCFSLDTPETEYTLAQLQPQIARTEISLAAWLPKKGEPPTPGAGKLPREFEMMHELSKKKIPLIASIWNLPEWMCRPIEIQENERVVTYTGVRPELWPDVIDAIGAYLLYAKEKYDAEPDYFSFNETDCGAKIKLSADEHRDLIKRAGTQFEKIGLKTKCLLGDVSNPRVSLDFLKPSLDDPDAMKYVGALSFHSWGGGTPQNYAAWADLARDRKLPLFVCEAGVDAAAWQDGSFRTFDYFVREMTHYQELFQTARPQAVLYWEYTSDYGLLATDPKNAKSRVETERFALQKHWLKFVPPGSEALETTGGNAHVLLTAFREKEEHATQYTFNLSNAAWIRKTKITGIPPEIKALNVVQTSRGEWFKTLAPIVPVNGVVEIELPGQSFTTLTTFETK